MLDHDDRLFAPSGDITPGGPSIWHVIDWDQRRLVSVVMDEDLDSEDPAFEHLLKYIDHLPPDVYSIHVTSDGDLISASADPKDDETRCVFRPPVESLQIPDGIEVVSRQDLEEVDRLGPNVDVVVRPQSAEPTKQLVFKYYFMFQSYSFIWHEMSLWMRLPKHPNIVPFDSVVVDEIEGRLVGFTSVFIPGGTLDENKTRCFKLKWLHQLMALVDELNLKYGVAHQDVAPRNLVIDEVSDSLMIFDFNFSARIGRGGYDEARDDVKGVIFTMYEIITRNDRHRRVRHEEQDVSIIEGEEWVKHPDVLLDHPVSEFRAVLAAWSEKRRAGTQITKNTEATDPLEWPPLPEPPLTERIWEISGHEHRRMKKLYHWRRNELLEKGQAVLDWQRCPSKEFQAWPLGRKIPQDKIKRPSTQK
uniref:Protein kinase domain-containing protein n=1 Tax=Bionectria ochroleuca TaxID=29856 RepID=A0A8H7NQ99_BIOOC